MQVALSGSEPLAVAQSHLQPPRKSHRGGCHAVTGARPRVFVIVFVYVFVFVPFTSRQTLPFLFVFVFAFVPVFVFVFT